MKKFIRLYNTLKYLKAIQFYYRFYYLVKAKLRKVKNKRYQLLKQSNSTQLKFFPSIPANRCYIENRFKFLNLEKMFNTTIDWNYSEYGKLWTYNLSYFDFLQQNDLPKEEGIKLIQDFILQSNSLKDALEPFPISLRGINWIKFFSRYNIQNQTIDNSLYWQYSLLHDNLEFHLLGNHLLENAFSLLFGAYYFQNEIFYSTAKKILTNELKEQILDDGGHFELSPMYHQIMLYRVLDCINLIQNNSWKNQELLPLLTSKAEPMLGWLKTITYSNGTIPLLNDSSNGIAPTSQDLFEYAHLLGIFPIILPLAKSGYRKIIKENYECIVDVGNIGPDYIPGHAHSDTFNFELHINGKPLIIDTGISTYESNRLRHTERSTAAHNTVMVNGIEQSEVWGGFRVANRAKVTHLIENATNIEATHDGYLKIGALHTRKFSFNTNKIIIEDTVKGKKSFQCIAYLHCHPDAKVIINNDLIKINNVIITCSNHNSIIQNNYNYASGFNTLIPATVISIIFTNVLKMEIAL